MSESLSISLDGARGLVLQREPLTTTFLPGVGRVYLLQVAVVDAYLMPAEVFVHQRNLDDPHDPVAQEDEFCYVASPFDVTLYPVDEPPGDYFPQFFRRASFKMTFRSLAEVEEAYAAVKSAVEDLIAGYNNLDAMGEAVEQTVVHGGRSLTLSRRQTFRRLINQPGAVRLRVEITDAVNVVANLFGFRRRVVNAAEGVVADEFAFVCSAADALTYPTNEPDPIVEPAFFRKSLIDVLVPTHEAAETVWLSLLDNLKESLETFAREDALAVEETDTLS